MGFREGEVRIAADLEFRSETLTREALWEDVFDLELWELERSVGYCSLVHYVVNFKFSLLPRRMSLQEVLNEKLKRWAWNHVTKSGRLRTPLKNSMFPSTRGSRELPNKSNHLARNRTDDTKRRSLLLIALMPISRYQKDCQA
jgi:hypothetical protein